MKKIGWIDMLIYRLFYWRWSKLLSFRPDLREMMISWLKAYDVVDEGEKVKVTVSIEKVEDV